MASEVTEREKVILIADALVDSVTGMGRRYLFRPAPKAGQHGASVVEFAVQAAEKAGVPLQNELLCHVGPGGGPGTFGPALPG